MDLVRLSCLLAQSLNLKAAAHIDCEPAEVLVALIPEDIYSRSRFSISELAAYLETALQADGS